MCFRQLCPLNRHVSAVVSRCRILLVAGLVNSNLIQANSVAHTLVLDFGLPRLGIAVVLALTVGLVVVGGVRWIVRVSVALAPLMLGVYVVLGLAALVTHPWAALQSLGQVLHFSFGAEAA